MQNPIIPGRSCKNCTLCCKVMRIYELNKPPGLWCSHCKPGIMCTIYENRPDSCRIFYCQYLTNGKLNEKWRPSRSRIVISRATLDVRQITAHVDPQRPDAWKQAPYYSQLKDWARWAIAKSNDVIVLVGVGARQYVVFPDRDVDLGVIAEGDTIVTSQRMTPAGIQWEVKVSRKEAPQPARNIGPATAADADLEPCVKKG
jgi:hypothetical protein